MQLLLVRNLWGLQDDPDRYVDVLPAVAEAGYDAVACPVQLIPDEDAFGAALSETGLAYVAQVFTFGKTVDDHVEMFREALGRAAAIGVHHVVAQAGRDAWPLDVGVGFLRQALETADRAGVVVAHETHRSRILYAPWVAERVLAEVPDLPVACDLSHWTCVAESLRLPNAAVEAVAANAIHVDARVGHEEGPQVPDPRSEHFATHLAAFEAWWDHIWELRRTAGAEELALMPEFGPPPYQAIHPATGEPLADVNECNDWMAARLRARYGAAAS